MRLRLLLSLALVVLVLTGCGRAGSSSLRVSGNRLVIGAGAGRVVQLRGVNRSGTEYKCEQGSGFFESPTPDRPDGPAMIAAMTSWDIDVVRVPLNEGCWLGVGAPAAYSGRPYQQAVGAYVRELNRAGLFVILDLHWVSVNGSAADITPPLPDAANGPRFWRSVATVFKADPDVLYDLYNEPFGVSWSCWRNGCEVPVGTTGGTNPTDWPTYAATGMQRLVNVVRATGSRQPLLIGGLSYALDLSGWLANEPSDPDHDLVASVHSYGGLSPCSSGCFSTIAATAQKVPVVFGEMGETDCASDYIDPLMAFADRHGIGYLGWAWDAPTAAGWSCGGGPSLISSYTGIPTAYGAGVRGHLQQLGQAVRPRA